MGTPLFIASGTTPYGAFTGSYWPKVSNKTPELSIPVNQGLLSSDANTIFSSLVDVRAQEISGVFRGLMTSSTDPLPTGIFSYVWSKGVDKSLRLTVGGVEYYVPVLVTGAMTASWSPSLGTSASILFKRIGTNLAVSGTQGGTGPAGSIAKQPNEYGEFNVYVQSDINEQLSPQIRSEHGDDSNDGLASSRPKASLRAAMQQCEAAYDGLVIVINLAGGSGSTSPFVDPQEQRNYRVRDLGCLDTGEAYRNTYIIRGPRQMYTLGGYGNLQITGAATISNRRVQIAITGTTFPTPPPAGAVKAFFRTTYRDGSTVREYLPPLPIADNDATHLYLDVGLQAADILAFPSYVTSSIVVPAVLLDADDFKSGVYGHGWGASHLGGRDFSGVGHDHTLSMTYDRLWFVRSSWQFVGEVGFDTCLFDDFVKFRNFRPRFLNCLFFQGAFFDNIQGRTLGYDSEVAAGDEPLTRPVLLNSVGGFATGSTGNDPASPYTGIDFQVLGGPIYFGSATGTGPTSYRSLHGFSVRQLQDSGTPAISVRGPGSILYLGNSAFVSAQDPGTVSGAPTASYACAPSLWALAGGQVRTNVNDGYNRMNLDGTMRVGIGVPISASSYIGPAIAGYFTGSDQRTGGSVIWDKVFEQSGSSQFGITGFYLYGGGFDVQV